MTVKIHGPLDDEEYESAIILKNIFEEDSQVKNHDNEIHILPSVQCIGQDPQDIDLVVFGRLKNYNVNTNCYLLNDNKVAKRTVKVDNFCFVIEVKKHSSENLVIEGNKLFVKYTNNPEREHNASEQNRKQVFSLKNYLGANLRVIPIILLRNVSKNELENKINKNNNIIFFDSVISELWSKVFLQWRPVEYKGNIYFSSINNNEFESQMQKWLNKLTFRVQPSRLDRQKIEYICKMKLKGQEYHKNLGNQMLVFRGRGGTGKTYNLLRLSHDIYKNYGGRVIILTYNNALAADIKRLFAIMQIRNGIDQSIKIKTTKEYFYQLFYQLGITKKEDIDKKNYGDYEAFKNQAKIKIEQICQKYKISTISDKLSQNNPDLFSWDYIMVDEAQDWPENERDLLFKIFGHNKIIIADGLDQLVRQNNSCNWITPSIKKNSQIVSLRKSLRQKNDLTRFISDVSKNLGYAEWDVENNKDASGGKVIILEGEYTKSFHETLVARNKVDKNENIDMLFCIPPSWINRQSKTSKLTDKFDQWKYNYWDGSIYKNRKNTFPSNTNEFRILQYDSCRGLEGWININLGFDQFYEYKINTFKNNSNSQLDFYSEDEKKKIYATRWLLIPLTRAIDTIVLQIENKNSYISNILRKIYEKNTEFIEWRKEDETFESKVNIINQDKWWNTFG